MTTPVLERTTVEPESEFPANVTVSRSGRFSRRLRVEWPVSGQWITFDSTYEYDYWLLTKHLRPDVTILRNTTKIPFPRPISYTLGNGATKTLTAYRPDFIVIDEIGHTEWVEIKGWQNAKHQAVREALTEFYPDFRVTLITRANLLEAQKAHGQAIKGWVKIK